MNDNSNDKTADKINDQMIQNILSGGSAKKIMPLAQQILRAIQERYASLTVQLPLTIAISLFVVIVAVSLTVYQRFHSRMIDEFTWLAKGVTRLMAEEIDGDKVDTYIKKNYGLPEYREIIRKYTLLKESYPDILYLYVYKIQEDGGHVVLDLDSSGAASQDGPGSIYKLDAPFASKVGQIMAGETIPPYAVHTRDGEYLFSYIYPVFDSNGDYACSVCVDFSLERLHAKDLDFALRLFVTFLALSLIMTAVDILIIRKNVTIPLNQIIRCTKEFSYDTEEARFQNVQDLEALNIYSANEVGTLYTTFMSVMKESLFYMTVFTKARSDIEKKNEQISEISRAAYRDPLTGVGSKAAYEKAIQELAQEMQNGNRDFAIAMVDVNNLKMINDTYGHKEGDAYIKGCVKIICEVFKHSPVYRVGGDEFVVLIRNEDFQMRRIKKGQLATSFLDSYKQLDRQPWERYSASAGLATCRQDDETIEAIFDRADERMYQDKLEFKKKYGSYR